MQRLSLVLSMAAVLAAAFLIAGVNSGVVRGVSSEHDEQARRQLMANNVPTPAGGGGKGVPGTPTATTPGGGGTMPGQAPVAPYPYVFHNSKKNLTCPNAFSIAFHSVIQEGYKTRYCTNNAICSGFPTTDGIPCCLWPHCICGANTPNSAIVSCVTPLDSFLGQ